MGERARQAAREVERIWRADAGRQGLSDCARARAWPLYLVGGAVRDILLGREVADWDLAGPGATELARLWAEQASLRVVPLHEDLPTVRVIVRPGESNGFLDFADLRAATIADDLRARDFSINAIAWDVRGADEVLDPTGGLEDLARQLVRAPALTCLRDDPLRTLRALRLAAELAFRLEEQTASWVRQCAVGLRGVAGERVGHELLKLLGVPQAADALLQAHELGVLAQIVPVVREMEGVEQGGYHHLDVLGHTLLTLQEVERILNRPEESFPRSAQLIQSWLAEGGRPASLRLAALFHDVGKPARRTLDQDGHVHFVGHEEEGVRLFLQSAAHWALPTDLRAEVAAMIRLHLRPLQLANEALRKLAQGLPAEEALTLAAIRRLMRDAEPAGVGLILLAAADRAACRGPASDFAHRQQVIALLDDLLARYEAWESARRRLPRLVSGHDLMRELRLPPGPLIGDLLAAITQAQEEGRVTTAEQALELARHALKRARRG